MSTPNDQRVLASYGTDFYSQLLPGMHASARKLLSHLFAVYAPKSVVDIGCGHGAWLSACKELGCHELVGYDGPWVSTQDLVEPTIVLRTMDFESILPTPDGKRDLCISVEVAEHVSATRAGDFIDLLCTCSDVILFSAATRHQGGVNHINEQLPSYWINLFEARGYECFDVFRGAFWNDEQVEFWYRQNAFLFVNPAFDGVDRLRLTCLERRVLDSIHPTLLDAKQRMIVEAAETAAQPTLRSVVATVRAYVSHRLRRLAS